MRGTPFSDVRPIEIQSIHVRIGTDGMAKSIVKADNKTPPFAEMELLGEKSKTLGDTCTRYPTVGERTVRDQQNRVAIREGRPTVKAYEPYNKLVRPLPDMRTETISLIHQAVGEHIQSHVLVNNRSEGSAPLTVQALVDQLKSER